MCDARADLIASHGQTVYHWTGRPVVADFRSRDVAAGGQGAPLVSAIDVLWLRGRPGTSVVLNLGGIANITVAAADRDPVAYDTGPASALIDAAVHHFTGGALMFDVDGAMAARGRVRDDLLGRLLAEEYYARPPPKSTGKELFHLAYLDAAIDGVPDLKPDDVVATLTALTARAVADAVRAHGAVEVIASGGGIRNPALMAALRAELTPVPVRTADELGLPSAAKEAYALAILGFLTALGLPSTVPSCSGARHASVLGSITPGRTGIPKPPPPTQPPSSLRIQACPDGQVRHQQRRRR